MGRLCPTVSQGFSVALAVLVLLIQSVTLGSSYWEEKEPFYALHQTCKNGEKSRVVIYKSVANNSSKYRLVIFDPQIQEKLGNCLYSQQGYNPYEAGSFVQEADGVLWLRDQMLTASGRWYDSGRGTWGFEYTVSCQGETRAMLFPVCD